MTAAACLKVLVRSPPASLPPEAVARVVAKVGGAYLESTWRWPRRHGLIAPCSFMLADPSAEALDGTELRGLAAQLQLKLFGEAGGGKVALMMFEGRPDEMGRLAGASLERLEAILADSNASFGGHITRITSLAVQDMSQERAALHIAHAARPDGPPTAFALPSFSPEGQDELGWWSIYFAPNQRFIGSVMNWRPQLGAAPIPPVEANGRDLEVLRKLHENDRMPSEGYLFVPVEFSTLVKPTLRGAYQAELAGVAAARDRKFAATIYDVPREPSFGAMAELQRLKPYFSLIDLRVTDPDFQVAKLPAAIVNSVTLVLNGRSELERLAALNRFHEHALTYKARRIWQGVTNLRAARELESCLRLGTPFLSGPVVAPLTRNPGGQTIWPAGNLPYQAWTETA